jgi:hypothetical protein
MFALTLKKSIIVLLVAGLWAVLVPGPPAQASVLSASKKLAASVSRAKKGRAPKAKRKKPRRKATHAKKQRPRNGQAKKKQPRKALAKKRRPPRGQANKRPQGKNLAKRKPRHPRNPVANKKPHRKPLAGKKRQPQGKKALAKGRRPVRRPRHGGGWNGGDPDNGNDGDPDNGDDGDPDGDDGDPDGDDDGGQSRVPDPASDPDPTFDLGSLGVVAGRPVQDGLKITAVVANSPARWKGLEAGDVIESVGQSPIQSLRDLKEVIQNSNGGLRLKVLKRRTGSEVTIFVRLRPAG